MVTKSCSLSLSSDWGRLFLSAMKVEFGSSLFTNEVRIRIDGCSTSYYN
jgi:hypothetical protein